MDKRSTSTSWLAMLVAGGLGIAALWFVFGIYTAGQPVWAMATLVLLALTFYVYLADIGFAHRYLLTGILDMLLFVACPLPDAMQLGFTHYSSSNLLSQDRAAGYLLA